MTRPAHTAPTSLDELIQRLEEASEGSRELDWAIAEALGEVPNHTIRPVGFDYDWYRSSETSWALWKAKDSEGRSTDLWQPKQRTTSLDAAMGLVPEGKDQQPFPGKMAWCVTHERENSDPNRKHFASVREFRTSFDEDHLAWAATPALALCTAALKALRAQGEK